MNFQLPHKTRASLLQQRRAYASKRNRNQREAPSAIVTTCTSALPDNALYTLRGAQCEQKATVATDMFSSTCSSQVASDA